MRSKSPELMRQIKSFAEHYFAEYLRSPSLAEIAGAAGIGRTTAYDYLVRMNELGMIAYDGKMIRTEQIDGLIRQMRPENTIRAAVLGNVSCGLPNLAEENIEEYVSLPASLFGRGDYFILRARGQSMIDAGIDDGDLVIIEKRSVANNGDIVVALVDDETTLKRFYAEQADHRIRLHPENAAMSDIIVDHCVIQGVAVKVLKDL